MKRRGWNASVMVRAIVGLLVIASMVVLPASPAAPSARADDLDPPARVMLKINRIHIYDRGDPTYEKGEPNYYFKIQRTAPGCGGVCHGPYFEQTLYFSGVDGGDVKEVNQFIPAYRAQNAQFFQQPVEGLDLYPGMSVLIEVKGRDSDPFFVDNLGSFRETFDESENWGMGAEHQSYSDNVNDKVGCGDGLFGCPDSPGFRVDYEIAPAPLPDLVVSEIRVGNFADNGDDIVCVTAANLGPEPAGALSPNSGTYALRFYVDGVTPPNGETRQVGPLRNLDTDEWCFQTTVAAGQHSFAATVDEGREIPEMNELNNSKGIVATIARRLPGGIPLPIGPLGEGPGLVQTDPEPTPTPTATPTRTPTPTQADLLPLNPRVKGKEPSGENDCDPGKNDVTVRVHNQGTANAGQFTVALLVDGDQEDGGQETVQSLGSGQQRDVRFDDVRLKKGTHQLTVKVDSESKVTESNEDNNQLDFSVTCRDEED